MHIHTCSIECTVLILFSFFSLFLLLLFLLFRLLFLCCPYSRAKSLFLSPCQMKKLVSELDRKTHKQVTNPRFVKQGPVSQFFTSHVALPLLMIYLSSVRYLCFYFTSFEVVFCMTEALSSNYLALIRALKMRRESCKALETLLRAIGGGPY